MSTSNSVLLGPLLSRTQNYNTRLARLCNVGCLVSVVLTVGLIWQVLFAGKVFIVSYMMIGSLPYLVSRLAKHVLNRDIQVAQQRQKELDTQLHALMSQTEPCPTVNQVKQLLDEGANPRYVPATSYHGYNPSRVSCIARFLLNAYCYQPGDVLEIFKLLIDASLNISVTDIIPAQPQLVEGMEDWPYAQCFTSVLHGSNLIVSLKLDMAAYLQKALNGKNVRKEDVARSLLYSLSRLPPKDLSGYPLDVTPYLGLFQDQLNAVTLTVKQLLALVQAVMLYGHLTFLECLLGKIQDLQLMDSVNCVQLVKDCPAEHLLELFPLMHQYKPQAIYDRCGKDAATILHALSATYRTSHSQYGAPQRQQITERGKRLPEIIEKYPALVSQVDTPNLLGETPFVCALKRTHPALSDNDHTTIIQCLSQYIQNPQAHGPILAPILDVILRRDGETLFNDVVVLSILQNLARGGVPTRSPIANVIQACMRVQGAFSHSAISCIIEHLITGGRVLNDQDRDEVIECLCNHPLYSRDTVLAVVQACGNPPVLTSAQFAAAIKTGQGALIQLGLDQRIPLTMSSLAGLLIKEQTELTLEQAHVIDRMRADAGILPRWPNELSEQQAMLPSFLCIMYASPVDAQRIVQDMPDLVLCTFPREQQFYLGGLRRVRSSIPLLAYRSDTALTMALKLLDFKPVPDTAEQQQQRFELVYVLAGQVTYNESLKELILNILSSLAEGDAAFTADLSALRSWLVEDWPRRCCINVLSQGKKLLEKMT